MLRCLLIGVLTCGLCWSGLALPLPLPQATAQQKTDAAKATPVADESLFDGKSLQGWRGDTTIWTVQDGAITGTNSAEKPIKDNSFLIWDGELGDFELRLKFRIEGGNSGIQFRSQDLGEFHVGGYQADIDSADTYIGILYDERGRGILAGRGEKVEIDSDGERNVVGQTCDPKKFLESYKATEWNEYIVRAEGNHITQTVNGIVTVDIVDAAPDGEAKGILALQVHSGPPMKVQFKDIALERLNEK